MTASDPEQNVRKLATEILTRVEIRKSYVDALLDHALRSRAFRAPDRALLTELTYGALRWRGRLDAHLKKWMRRPLRDTDPFVRNLLRLTLYQLLFLDRVPVYAAVNEAVQIAKAQAGGKAGGFVNGVLRNFLRANEQLTRPDPEKSPIAAIAEYWSHPDWLVERWLKYFGAEETKALLEANNAEAPMVLRTNLRKTTQDKFLSLLRSQGVEAAPTSWSPHGVTLLSRLPIEIVPGFADGLFQVQGEASQLVVYLLGPKPGERILDACAAPGGKTTHLAESMDDRGEIIATDISQKGLKKLKENSERLGLKSVRGVHADVSKRLDSSLSHPFDRILIDAPCSGFGTLRSHPEIKWNRDGTDIKRLQRLQKAILARVSSYLKPGGVLVYSTCTLTEDEDEDIVKDFLEQHHEFVLEDAAGYLPEHARSLVRGSYFMTLPHRHNTDGFFAARMRKVV